MNDLPVPPPVAPMLARLARDLPEDGFLYEPKWDGFRCLVFRSRDQVDLRSRHDSPFARYFPELVEGFRALHADRIVLDGEIILVRATGFDFEALMTRLHPAASRVERLRQEIPASFICFDLLALGDRDVRSTPFEERRALLQHELRDARPPIFLTPLTDDRDTARLWFERFQGAGVDGVVAKHRGLRYEPGKRVMVKVKHERTADCVVAGLRLFADRPVLSSLLLGLYDAAGDLRHVGVVTQFPAPARAQILQELTPLAVRLEDHPWRQGFLIGRSPVGRLKGSAGRWTPEMEHDWVPLRPDRVCEVGFDQLDLDRFRHPARFRRWRPDRDPRSCTLDQLTVSAPQLEEILALA